MKFAQIILPLNLKGTFTYKVPAELAEKIEIGMRVLIPFGGKKIYTGIVFDLHDLAPENFEPKEIINLLDDSPILPKEQISFWTWLSEYYLCNIGEIYRFAFPSSLKLESETYLKLKSGATIDFQNLDVNEMYLIQALEVRQLINLTEIEAFIPKKEIVKTIKSLIDLQYIEIDEKIAEKYKAKEIAFLKINEEEVSNKSLAQILLLLKKAPKQQELFLLLLEKHTEDPEKTIKKSDVFEDGNFAHSQLKSLLEKNLVVEYYLQKDRLQKYEGEIEDLDSLTDAQLEAKTAIDKAFDEGKNVLLHGVTSSGKTHLYLDQIEETIEAGKNVLFLLPEIAITKQIVQRLEKKYGKQLGFYHQKLTDFERVEVWRSVKNNDLKINLSNYLSQELHQDYNTLSNLFSEVENTTIEKYFINQKIEKVKELIMYDELSLSEIAYSLNYSSVSHLSNQFKKVTGFSPTYFKNIKTIKRKQIEDL